MDSHARPPFALALLCLFAIAVVSHAQERSPIEEAKGLVEEGNKQFDAGKTEDALAAYRRAYRADCYNPEVLCLLGHVYHKQGRFQDAFGLYEECRARADRAFAAAFERESARERDRLWELLPKSCRGKTPAQVQYALKKSPDDADLIRGHALLLCMYRQYRDAANAFGKVELADAMDPLTAAFQVKMYLSVGNHLRGIEIGEKLMRRFPDAPLLLAMVGACYARAEGGDKRAEQLFGLALSKDPDCWMAHDEYGSFLMRRNRASEAEEHLKKSVAVNPYGTVANGQLAKYYFSVRQDFDAAFQHYYRLYKISPKYYDEEYAETQISKCFAVFVRTRVGLSRNEKALTDMLRDRNPAVRAAAAQNLGKARAAGALPALKDLLDDDNPTVREAAIDAACSIGGAEAEKLAEECLKDERVFVRGGGQAVACGLAKRPAKAAMKHIKSSDIYARHCAYLVLIKERNNFDGSIAIEEALNGETDERIVDFVKHKIR